MARPQTEDGFVMLALDLFPAIMAAGLSGYAQIVLAEVLLQWAGPQKRTRFYLVGSEFAAKTGLDRNNARRAIRELVEANILEEDGDEFSFNKDYDSWTPKAGPLGERLYGKMIEWIKRSVARHGAANKHKHKSKNSGSTQTQATLKFERPTESNGTHRQLSERVYLDSLTTDVVSLSRLTDNCMSESNETHSHIDERARKKTGEGRIEKGEGDAPGPVSSPSRSTDPDAADVIRVATERWGASNGDRIISDFLREFAPRWIRLAMDDMHDTLKGRFEPRYLRRILERYRQQGGPDERQSKFSVAAVPAAPVDNSHRYTRAPEEFDFPGTKGEPR